MTYSPLDIRIRKIIRYQILLERSDNFFLYLISRKNKKNNYEFLIKLFILLISVILCVWQTVDRINYYNSTPTAVDVSLTGEFMCKITACHPFATGIANLKTIKDESDSYLNLNELLFPIYELFGKKNLTTHAIWNASSTRSMVSEASLLNAKGAIVYPLIFTDTDLLFGKCTTFSYEKESLKDMYARSNSHVIEIIFYTGMRKDPIGFIFIHDRDSKANEKEILTINLGRNIDVKVISLRKYFFLNYYKSPCESQISFEKCFENCIVNIVKNQVNCRLPFMKHTKNLNYCLPGKTIHPEDYLNILMSVLSVNLQKDCNCTRACSRITFKYTYSTRLTKETSKSFLKLILNTDAYITFARERYLYDFVALLIDIGGNLGLYLGWCVLSLLEGFQMILEAKELNSRLTYLKRIDPLHKVRTFMNERKHSKSRIIKQSQFCFWLNKFQMHLRTTGITKCTVMFFSVNTFIYGSYWNIIYYLSEPVITSVYVEENHTVQFPDIILCGDNVDVIVQKNRIRKMKKLKDFCDVNFLDILKIKSADKLWKSSNFSKNWFPLEKINNTPQLNAIKKKLSEIYTPYGICVKVQTDSVNFEGVLTSTMLMLTSPNKCKNYVINIILQLPGKINTDYASLDFLPSKTLSVFLIVTKQLHRLNFTKRKCVSEDEAAKCRNQCLLRQEKKNVFCRLPYMVKDSRPMCKSVTEAIEAQNCYLKMNMEFEYVKHCDCSPPCNETIYEIIHYVNELPLDALMLTFFFPHNIIEHVVEMQAVTFISLLCIIGNYLGLLLGICLYSILNAFIPLNIKCFNTLHCMRNHVK